MTEDEKLEAQERLNEARVTHLDHLADKLREDRVRRVVAPMLTGAADLDSYADWSRDAFFARDLGLLAQHDAKLHRPIRSTRRVIPRELVVDELDDAVECGGGVRTWARTPAWTWPVLVVEGEHFLGEQAEHVPSTPASWSTNPSGDRAGNAAAGMSCTRW